MTTAPTTRPALAAVAADMNWRGRSGETVTGPVAAQHLRAALALLDERGWTRTPAAGEGERLLAGADDTWSVKRLLLAFVRLIREDEWAGPLTVSDALYAVSDSTDGDIDSWTGALRCTEAVLQARTGDRWAELSAWTGKRGRTVDEVRGLLTEAADFAIQYGPTA